jgi:hypothetical protein
MKAVISIEYFASLLIFIIFSIYIFTQAQQFRPQYVQEVRNQILQIEAYQVSELLINDPGEPVNWNAVIFSDPSRVKRIGLNDHTVNKTNVISPAKIAAVNTLCNTGGYSLLKQKLDVDFQFSLYLLNKRSSELLFSCLPAAVIPRPVTVNFTRIVAFGSEYGELILQIWG